MDNEWQPWGYIGYRDSGNTGSGRDTGIGRDTGRDVDTGGGGDTGN